MAALRDVSLILVALEAMVLMLIPALVVGAAWYGMRWLRRKLPPLFAQVRKYVTLVQRSVERASAAVVAPLIAAHVLVARLGAWWTALAGFTQEGD